LLRGGEPVVYEKAKTPAMQGWDGFGDCNVPWSVWVKGAALPTS